MHHSAIGTRVDAQVAIEQRLEARKEIPQPNFREEPMEDGESEGEASSGGQSGDAGPSSNPFRPPPEKPNDDAPPAIAHVLVSDPSNTIQLDDEFVALQFHETCLEHGIPDFSSICTAVCLGKNQAGPWLIAVSTDAAQAISDGELPHFECFTEDAEELTLRVLPCDPYCKPIRSTASKSHTDARKIDQKQKADEMKILLLFHLPPRCLGKSLADGHLNRVREMIEATTKKMTGTKYSLIQGLTAKLKQKKNTLYLFLNPPLNLADPYRDVRPHLPELSCLPYSADGLEPEPISCFMPPPMGIKLGLRTCCFRTPDICEQAANGGRCTFKKDLLRSWGIRPAVPDPGREQREERKRARVESDARAYDAVNAAKALRVENIKKKLCNFFSLGKVSPAPPPPSHHRTPTIPHPIIVRQFELQAEARLWLRQVTHRLRLCTQRREVGPGVTAPHLPLHVTLRPQAMPLPESRRQLRVHSRHRRNAHVNPTDTHPRLLALVGPAVLPQGRTEGEQGLPVPPREPDGSRVGALDPQPSSFPVAAGARLPMQTLWLHSRLTLGPAGGQRANEHAHRRRVHECGVRSVEPHPQASDPTVRSFGTNRGRAPSPHGAPRHAYRPRVDNFVGRRRSESSIERTLLRLHAAPPPLSVQRPQSLTPNSSPLLTFVDRVPCLHVPHPPLGYRALRVYPIAVPPPALLSYRVLWHSSNILWLQGRLPWNVTRLCLS